MARSFAFGSDGEYKIEDDGAGSLEVTHVPSGTSWTFEDGKLTGGEFEADSADIAELQGSMTGGDPLTSLTNGDVSIKNGSLWMDATAERLDIGLSHVDIDVNKDWNDHDITNVREASIQRLSGNLVGGGTLVRFDGVGLTIDANGRLRLVQSEVAELADIQSVFGRKGDVTAEAGDYTHDQIGGVQSDQHHSRPSTDEMADAAPVQSVNGQIGAVNITLVDEAQEAGYADEAGTIAGDIDADTVNGYDIQVDGVDGQGIINFKTDSSS